MITIYIPASQRELVFNSKDVLIAKKLNYN